MTDKQINDKSLESKEVVEPSVEQSLSRHISGIFNMHPFGFFAATATSLGGVSLLIGFNVKVLSSNVAASLAIAEVAYQNNAIAGSAIGAFVGGGFGAIIGGFPGAYYGLTAGVAIGGGAEYLYEESHKNHTMIEDIVSSNYNYSKGWLVETYPEEYQYISTKSETHPLNTIIIGFAAAVPAIPFVMYEIASQNDVVKGAAIGAVAGGTFGALMGSVPGVYLGANVGATLGGTAEWLYKTYPQLAEAITSYSYNVSTAFIGAFVSTTRDSAEWVYETYPQITSYSYNVSTAFIGAVESIARDLTKLAETHLQNNSDAESFVGDAIVESPSVTEAETAGRSFANHDEV